MATIELRMKPQGDTLRRYMESRARVSFIMGPLGSGKTYQSCQKLLMLMCGQAPNSEGFRKTRFYAVRNTYPDLHTTTIKDWLELFGDLGTFKGGGQEPPTHKILFDLPDGTTVASEVVFLALDRADAIKKLRGAQVTGFWLNEVKELTKGVIDMADLRHGRYPSAMDGGPTWHGMIGDTNAPDQDHWYYELESSAPAGWEFFRQPGGVLRDGVDAVTGRVKWRPNPGAENLRNLPYGYYISGMEGKSDDWISVNLANEYGIVFDGKPVFPEYNDHLTIADGIKSDGGTIYRGWDFGLTPAVVFIQVTAEPRVVVLDEIVATDMGAERFAEQVLHHSQQYYPAAKFEDVGDPAGAGRSQADERTAFMVLQAKGIDIQPGIQTVLARLESVRYCMTRLVGGRPMLQIHPRCAMIRKALQGGYQYKRVQVVGADRYHNVPDKNKYSHCADALQYAIAMHIWPVISHRFDHQKMSVDPQYEPATVAGY